MGWDNTQSASSSVPVTWEIFQSSLHFNATSESELCCNSEEPGNQKMMEGGQRGNWTLEMIRFYHSSLERPHNGVF